MACYQTCDGCEYLRTEEAGKKDGKAYTFFICNLGKFERCPRSTIEHVLTEQERLSVPIPAWCKRGLGYVLDSDGCLRRKGEAYEQEA